MKLLKIRKDVQIYHPSPLIVMAGAILKCKHITFGVIGNPVIMNERTHKKYFEEYFEVLEDS